jgi:hypothetical protein
LKYLVTVQELPHQLRSTIDGGWNEEAAGRIEDALRDIQFLLKLTENIGTHKDEIAAPLASMRIKYV